MSLGEHWHTSLCRHAAVHVLCIHLLGLTNVGHLLDRILLCMVVMMASFNELYSKY